MSRGLLLFLAASLVFVSCGQHRGSEGGGAGEPKWIEVAWVFGDMDGIISGNYIYRLLRASGIPVRIDGTLSHQVVVPAALADKAEALIRDTESLRPYVSLPRLGLEASPRSEPVHWVIVDLPYSMAVERAADSVIRRALEDSSVRWAVEMGDLEFIHSVAVSERSYLLCDGTPAKAHVVHIRYGSKKLQSSTAPGQEPQWLTQDVAVFPD